LAIFLNIACFFRSCGRGQSIKL